MTELPPLPPTVPLTLTIQTPGVPVAGFPCLVVLHLRNPANASKRAGLPVLEDLGPPTHLSGSWRDSARAILASIDAIPQAAAETRPPMFSLDAGESRRLLVDLHALFGELPAGEGELELCYEPLGASGRCRLTAVAANAAEARFAARRPPRRSWRDVVGSGSLDLQGLAALSVQAREALALYLVHAQVVRAPALVELDARIFEGLPPRFEPEAAAFAYELAVARGEVEHEETRRAIVSRWPEIAWRLAEVDIGRGTLRLMRELYGIKAARKSGP